MRTRRDQVQAYRFVTRRIVSAMVSGEPETNELPMRRLGLGIVASLLVAVLVLAGFGVYGLVTGKGGTLDGDALVIEKGTGATYVYVSGRLHPALNYTSARLYFGATTPEVHEMSEAKLRGRARGRTMGIPDAPDSLPPAKALSNGAWQVCNTRPANRTVTHLVVGRSLPDVQPLGGRALIVTAAQRKFMLLNNRALRITEDSTLTGLQLNSATPVEVGEQLINAIPAGPDLKRLPVDRAGEPFPAGVDGQPAKVGELFHVSQEPFLLTAQGLVAVGEITERLVLAATGAPSRDLTLDVASKLIVPGSLEPEGFPKTIPEVDPSAATPGAICAAYQPVGSGAAADAGTTTIRVHPRTPAELAPPTDTEAQPGQTTPEVAAVHRVILSGGTGVLAQAAQASGAPVPGGIAFLLTDSGRKYALASPDAKAALGYGSVTPVGVPAAILALVPDGPALDPSAARLFADGGDR